MNTQNVSWWEPGDDYVDSQVFMNYLDKVDRFETVRVALEIMLLNVWFIFHLQFYVYLSLTV